MFVQELPQIPQPVAWVRPAALVGSLFIFTAIGPTPVTECSDDLGGYINPKAIRYVGF